MCCLLHLVMLSIVGMGTSEPSVEEQERYSKIKMRENIRDSFHVCKQRDTTLELAKAMYAMCLQSNIAAKIYESKI